MSDIQVTVLMTVYNGGRYLKESIRSVLGQTYADFELLIVNDASTDDSVRTIETFKDPRVVLVHNETNLGQTRSLNKGLSLAKGTYVARLDADDLVYPEWLSEQVRYITANPQFAVVSAQAVIIDEKGKRIRGLFVPTRQEDFIFRSLVRTPVNHVGSIMNKEALLSCGGYDERFKLVADYSLWSRLLRKNHLLAANDRILVAIREHSGSLSAGERGRLDIQEVAQVMIENINHFTRADHSSEAVGDLADIFYNESHVDEDRFHAAVDLLMQVVHLTASGLDMDSRQEAGYLKRMLKTVYLKRIYSLMEQGLYAQVKSAVWEANRKSGFCGIFLILSICSFCGIFCLKFVPRLYNGLMHIKISLKLLGRNLTTP